MTKEQWFEKATAYFDGTMTAEEVQFFEKETAENKELSQLMALWKNTDEEAAFYEQYADDIAVFITTHQKLKTDFVTEPTHELQNPADKVTTPEKKLIFSIWRWIAAAAIITGVIFIIGSLNHSSRKNQVIAGQKSISDTTKSIIKKDSSTNLANTNKDTLSSLAQTNDNTTSFEKLYADNFVPDKVPEDPNGPLADAFFYYASAQYKNAIEAIDSADKKAITRGNNSFTPLTNFYALYYKALSLMSLGKTRSASFVLQEAIPKSPSGTLQAKAQWYLALAFIKQGRVSSADQLLQSLTNNPSAGTYKSKAEALLSSLKK